MLNFYFKGLIVGLSIAVPVGPIAILCIKRTLAKGFASGFSSGLGAAAADAVFGATAAFGVTVVAHFLLSHSELLRFVGGIFLCYAGYTVFFSTPQENGPDTQGEGLFRDFISALALTLTNPLTIIMLAAIFAAAGLSTSEGKLVSASLMVCGIFSGSTLWWLILSGVTSVFHKRIPVSGLILINKSAGILIAAFGLFVLASLAISETVTLVP
jgi:threonine/homoserine/homoserine lactone efflux protein